MKKFFAMLCLAVLFAATGEARAAVIDFTGGGGGDGTEPASWQTDYDNLVPDVDVVFQTTYGRWNGFYNDFLDVAYNRGGGPLIIDFVGPVKLNSCGIGNFRGTVTSQTSYQIFDLSDLATPVINPPSFVVPHPIPSKPTYTVNYQSLTGIRLQFQGVASEELGLDDISFEAHSSAVPEPVTIAIWGIGACGMGIVARRKKKQTALCLRHQQSKQVGSFP
jgi:hypothetical protein